MAQVRDRGLIRRGASLRQASRRGQGQLLQLFLFAFAATLEVSNVPVGVINDDWGAASVKLISRLERASAFSEIRRYQSFKDAQAAIDSQQVMAVIRIPQDFSRDLGAGESPGIQVLLDGRKSNSAQLVNNYIGTIVAQFGNDWRLGNEAIQASEIVDRSWYNANRQYRDAMVPILIATLPMTMVLMIVGMSVAREQELAELRVQLGPAVDRARHAPRVGRVERDRAVAVGRDLPGQQVER